MLPSYTLILHRIASPQSCSAHSQSEEDKRRRINLKFARINNIKMSERIRLIFHTNSLRMSNSLFGLSKLLISLQNTHSSFAGLGPRTKWPPHQPRRYNKIADEPSFIQWALESGRRAEEDAFINENYRFSSALSAASRDREQPGTMPRRLGRRRGGAEDD